MKPLILFALCIGFVTSASRAASPLPPMPPEASSPTNETPASANHPVILMETSEGNITIELWPDKAPKTVENFLAYVDAGFFDGLIFHRVIKNFMIQGGGFTASMERKTTRPAIVNEARTDTPNGRGTLAMARTMSIHSATSQFFINLVDNAFLNHKNDTPSGFGYCVFGKVIDGMPVVDKIASTPTGQQGAFRDVPRNPILIERLHRVDESETP